MYRLNYSKQVDNTLRRMLRNRARIIRKNLTILAADPYVANNNAVKLQNEDLYRLRIGDWRAIFDIQEDELIVLIIRLAPHGKVYQ